jgi:uncharacterized protein (TIGR03545 family)
MNAAKGDIVKSVPPKKGFIRWEAILPAAIIIGLIAAYFILLLDSHLKKGIEFVGFSALGAEVNVDKVHTSFTKASLLIKNIQLTNGEKPTHNLASIGEIKFDMSWDALLRGKVLIEVASIDQIQFDSIRKTPGKVKPPEPESNEPSVIEKEGQKLANEALEKAKTEYGDNVLGDVANLLSGGKGQDQLKNLESQLKSKARIGEIQKDLAAKQLQWNEKLKALPQQKELNEWSEKFKKVKTKNFATPQELQDSLKQFQALLLEADSKMKNVEKSGQEFSADLKAVDADLKDLEKMVQADIKDLEAHFKIPKLDAQAITKSLFQRYAGPYLSQFNKYQNMAHKYLPPGLLEKKKDDKEDVQIQPRPRDRGISYEFGKPNSYPFFWLKKAKISSKATPGVPALGNLTGEAINVTSNQALIGAPTEIKFQGDFPELHISGIDAKITMNHITRPYRESFVAKVASFPVDKKMLLSGKDLELGFSKAIGSSVISASYSDKMLDFSISNAYKQLDYIVSASNKDVDGILKSIMNGIPVWTIDASGSGIFPDLPIELKSNLGGEIAQGFEKILQEKIAEARAKVKKIVDEIIAKEKAKLDSEVAKAKAQIDGEVTKIKEMLNKQKSELTNRVEETKKEEGKKVQKQIEAEVQKRLGPDSQKKLDDLKKKIKF